MTEDKLPVWQTMRFWLIVLAIIVLMALGQTDLAKKLISSEEATQVETHEPETITAPKEEPKEEGSTSATG